MNKKSFCPISLLFLLAFTLRFAGLSSNPPGFFRDEADKGYTSYSLMKTGMDQAGKHWPLFVRSLNVTTSSMYQYLDIPFIAGLGMTETAVRLPACFAGSLSVLAVYLLARKWWNSGTAFWAGLFVCFSPWSLLLSRWANQSILLTLWIPLGVYFLMLGREDGVPRVRDSLLSAFCLLAALYTYEPAQLFIPVFSFFAWASLLSRQMFVRDRRAAFLWAMGAFWLLFAAGSIPLLHHLLYQPDESAARFSRIGIFDGQPFYSAMMEFLRNYAAHLSPSFLFWSGDANLRHHSRMFGQIHLYLIPLIFIGLPQALRQRNAKDRILLAWLLCFPLAAACTRESIPHALRSVFAVPILQLLAANGLHALQENLPWLIAKLGETRVHFWRRAGIAVMAVCVSLHLADFFFRYPRYSAEYWEYGYRNVVDWWKTHHSEADGTVVTGLAEYPYIFFLFYNEYPPDRWIAEQRVEGVTFLPLGESADAHLQEREGRFLYLVRPMELNQIQPEKVVLDPYKTAHWKWTAWGKRLAPVP
ncbi:MAG: phospholipid carrier-dependent glycosyltransferase [Candidatus Omnitrophota bacterium]